MTSDRLSSARPISPCVLSADAVRTLRSVINSAKNLLCLGIAAIRKRNLLKPDHKVIKFPVFSGAHKFGASSTLQIPRRLNRPARDAVGKVERGQERPNNTERQNDDGNKIGNRQRPLHEEETAGRQYCGGPDRKSNCLIQFAVPHPIDRVTGMTGHRV